MKNNWYKEDYKTFIGLTMEEKRKWDEEAIDILNNIKKQIIGNNLAQDFSHFRYYICTSNGGYVDSYFIRFEINDNEITDLEEMRNLLTKIKIHYNKNTKWKAFQSHIEKDDEWGSKNNAFTFWLKKPMVDVKWT